LVAFARISAPSSSIPPSTTPSACHRAVTVTAPGGGQRFDVDALAHERVAAASARGKAEDHHVRDVQVVVEAVQGRGLAAVGESHRQAGTVRRRWLFERVAQEQWNGLRGCAEKRRQIEREPFWPVRNAFQNDAHIVVTRDVENVRRDVGGGVADRR
jgi:hypothetical protein